MWCVRSRGCLPRRAVASFALGGLRHVASSSGSRPQGWQQDPDARSGWVCRMHVMAVLMFFFSSRRRHTRWPRDWSSDVCSSDLSPHHTTSAAAMTGGGPLPRPGEVSLAHHGVLFLDELPEFHRDVLEVLRQPLEDGVVTVARVQSTATFPARFMLVAAMNPCPCGHFGDTGRECLCSPAQVARYLTRVSGPLLDRIDLHIEVPRVTTADLTGGSPAEHSTEIRARVMRAREVQRERFEGVIVCNAAMSPKQTRRFCRPDDDGRAFLRAAIERLSLSARAHDRALRLARTIADLDGSAAITATQLAEAVQYRAFDRPLRLLG